MNNTKTKDAILKYLWNANKYVMTEKISSDLGIPHFSIIALCKEMKVDGYVETTEITTIDSTVLEEYEVIITPKGQHFHFSGGYTKSKKINYEKWSFWIGVVVSTAIALTALLISLYKK